MARFVEPTKKQEKAWKKWLAERPECVRKIASMFDPWSLYLLNPTGHRVVLRSFSENGTVTVNVLARFNSILFERQVFGIDPNNLEPCDVPDPSEVAGAALTSDNVDENIDAIRVMVRPDLWTMGEDGIAIRKQ